ncbi:MAG: hypothetical protein JW764_08065, partial [Chlorobiaceae bacterium]|nr:hypothetical protein [Chlorobiaceae bacterium]
MPPRDLLTRLLDYIEEQAKAINPRAFRLSNTREFLRHRADLVGLPGVEFDISVEGDHFWLRVHRLEAHKPPLIDEKNREFIRIGDDPAGAKPSIDDEALKSHFLSAAEGKTAEEIEALERQHR